MQEEVNKKNAVALRQSIEALQSQLDAERAEKNSLTTTVADLIARVRVLEVMVQNGMASRLGSGPTAR